MLLRYPTWRFHPVKPATLVQTPEDEAERTPVDDGWTDSITAAREAAENAAAKAAADAKTDAARADAIKKVLNTVEDAPLNAALGRIGKGKK